MTIQFFNFFTVCSLTDLKYGSDYYELVVLVWLDFLVLFAILTFKKLKNDQKKKSWVSFAQKIEKNHG